MSLNSDALAITPTDKDSTTGNIPNMISTTTSKSATRLLPIIPYIAVLVGMYYFGSAWMAIGLYHAGMIAAMLTCRSDKHIADQKRKASPLLYLTPLVFAAGGLIFYLIWPYFDPNGAVSGRLHEYGINRSMWPYFAVYFCVVNSFVEELFWRGLLGNTSVKLHPNDLYFAGYHALVLAAFTDLVWSLPVFVACAFAGWLWRMLRSATGGLFIPIITHLVADVGIVIAVHARLFR
jgi:membrane protease YdiL (CAAX protease family)